MRLRGLGATTVAASIISVLALLAAPAQAAPRPAPPAAVSAFYTDSTVVGAGIPTFGAIAGLDRIGAGRYAMVPADAAPARFFTADIGYSSASGGFVGAPRIDGGGPILGAANLPILPGSARFEGIRRVGGGYAVASGGAQQFVRLTGPLGTHVRDLPLPKAWRTGLSGSRGLTGLAVGPRGQISVLTAGGLRQDRANDARLLTFGTGEFVYRVTPGRRAADVLAVNSTDYLVLERGKGRSATIYWATTRGADRVTGQTRLDPRVKPMTKRAIFSTAGVPRLHAGSMSGLAWGNWQPDLPWQKYRARALLVVTDSAPTQVHSFEVRLPR